MARRARISVVLVEHDEEITLHFEDRRLAPLWFRKDDRAAAFSELKQAIDDASGVEEVPVIGGIHFQGPAGSGQEEPASA